MDELAGGQVGLFVVAELSFVGVLLFGGLMSMVSFVDTKEVAVVYRLGVLNRILESGIHLHYPHPIETVEQLSLRSTRVVELGEQLVLTGDANLVNINTFSQQQNLQCKHE